MPRIWRPWSTRPPMPFVEDELESLSHELGGLSLIGEKPGVEGACQRGTIDQLPILLASEHVPRSATADTDTSTSQPPSLVSESSRESFGPRTPPPVHAAPLSEKDQTPKVDASASHVEPSIISPNFESHFRLEPVQSMTPEAYTGELHPNARMPQLHHPSPSLSHVRLTPSRNTSTEVQLSQPDTSVRRPTIAELLEEKLRLRKELKALHQYSDEERGENLHRQAGLPQSAPPSPLDYTHVNMDAVEYISEPISPHSSAQVLFRSSSKDREIVPSIYTSTRHSQQPSFIQTTPPQKRSPPPLMLPYEKKSTRPQRAVSFAEKPHYLDDDPCEVPAFHRQDSDFSPTRPSVAVAPVRRVIVHAHESSNNLALRPCPRSYAVAGYQDWYTISGLEHLNICPSCMAQIGNSKFRDYFKPSVPSARTRIICSFSEVWTRLAWIQTMKKGYETLQLLYEVTRPTGLTCPGRRLSTQVWHRIIDHETALNVPKFAACSACVRNLRLLMPQLQHSFRRQPVVQEKICDLAVDSPRFVQYVDLLDAAANQSEYYRDYDYPDITEFIDYFQRKCNLRDCRRQRPILGTWHYIPSLPEFTVCEDCYDDVVRPLVAAQKPLARKLASPPRLVPGSAPNRCREASCQLYSPRMRAKFRDAVLNNDYRMLESVALSRFDAEQRFRDREDELFLVPEADRGSRWEEEWRHNLEQWKEYE